MEHERAVANAIALEAKKDGLIQRQNGTWMLRLVVAELDPRIINAPMGTRFQCAFVEIGDDEQPVDHKNIERNRWAEMGAVQQAGMRCRDARFREFLRVELHFEIREDPENPTVAEGAAASAVRYHCGVDSRSELGRPGMATARIKWHQMDNAFQAWMVSDT